MRKTTEVEAIIEHRRRRLGMSIKEVALASVGAVSTWYLRMDDPLSFRHLETQRLFNHMNFTPEMQEQFNKAMRELGEKA